MTAFKAFVTLCLSSHRFLPDYLLHVPEMIYTFGEGNIRLPPTLSLTPLSQPSIHQNAILKLATSLRLPKRYLRLVIGIFIVVLSTSIFQTKWIQLERTTLIEISTVIPYPEVQDTPPFNETAGLNSTIPPLPPLYERYREYEDDLSVQNLLRHPHGITEGRYIFFANHAHECGWGNVLQEMVFSVMLAVEAKLGYVWDDYTWDRSSKNYSDYNGHPVTSRIPLSTMVRGYILGIDESGDSINTNSDTSMPSSISSRVYERLCPQIERIVIDTETVESYLQVINSEIILSQATGKQVLEAWLAVLNTPKYKNAHCIEVNKFSPNHVFDIWLFGSPRLHSLWDTVSNSPVLKQWSWSPLIKRAFFKNIEFFTAKENLQITLAEYAKVWWSYLAPASKISAASSNSSAYIPEVTIKREAMKSLLNDTHPLPILALHLRRGDFQEHCANLAEWRSTYTGFNSFPESRVRDTFEVPDIVDQTGDIYNGSDPREVRSTDERKEVYTRHCFPDVQEIVRRVREVIIDYAALAHEKQLMEMQSLPKPLKNWRWWMPDAISNRMKNGQSEDVIYGDLNSMQNRSQGSVDVANHGQGVAAAKDYLKRIYILTNGESSWLDKVEDALQQDAFGGWDGTPWEWQGITTSRDLHLGWEEQPVSQVLDMYVAQRAEVFIGNGFSSFTSNIVMLRMMAGFDSLQTRFW